MKNQLIYRRFQTLSKTFQHFVLNSLAIEIEQKIKFKIFLNVILEQLM